ncbi:MAG: CoA transferase [Boseongicola sp. SB0662_bin_57]|nr:CoA transferase [Boseongicola sp. SB0662_bin_57]
MGLPLEGVRVLAVEQYGAGPFGTQHLADLGAEVIKVENRQSGGDYARALGPYFVEGAEGDDGSLFFQSVNRNKRSLTLDLARPGAQRIFRRLVAGADAVANNLRGDVPERLGLTYDALKPANAAIVCAHCSGYGRAGPRRDWPGYDYLMQAETGYFHLTGEPEAPPARVGLSVVDFMAGTYMALGLVAGVLSARSTGRGRDVDVNLYDTALCNLSYLNTWALNAGYDPARVPRSAHVSLVPCQLYRTSDGWLYVMCNKEKFWPVLCDAVGRPDLARDPRFATYADRLGRRDELTVILDEALSARTSDAWLRELRGRVPVAPIRTPRAALQDSRLEAEGRIETLALEGGAAFRMLRSPIRTGDDVTSRACPPMGHDTVGILQDAGYSDEDIAGFREKGLI